jgi:molecular chaperone GrpE
MNENEKNQTATQPEETNDLSKQLAECQSQANEWKDRALRTAADYENFKKRSEKERLLWISSAQSAVLLDLISIVDDFDRAFSSLPSLHLSGSSDSASSGGQARDQSRAGFELIYKSLQKILEKYGIQEIKDLSHFDPTKHEAIMQVESADHKPGDIVQVLQKGYLFKGEVLRPAKVSVAK